MWRFKLSQLLSSAPEYLIAVPRGDSPVRGKYLRLTSLGNTPCALGRALYEAKDSRIYELIALREGFNALVIEICKHPLGSTQYENWLRHVTDQSEAAKEQNYPLLLERLSCGSTVKVMPYVSRTPKTDWRSRLPVRDIEKMLGTKDILGALNLCQRLLDEHGPKGILLEEMAHIRRRQSNLQEARHLFEHSVKAHRQEGNASILSALLELAVTLLDLHQTETLPNSIEIDLGDGIKQRQIITPVDPESPMPPTDLSDIALEVLLESLFVEPYFSSALLLLCEILGNGWEAEMFGLVANAFLSIDPLHSSADAIKEQLGELTVLPQEATTTPAGAPSPSPDVPPQVADMLRAIDAAYESPIPEDVVSPESLVCASQFHAGRGDMKRAERDLRRALELSPGNRKVVAALADLWCHEGKWEQAREWLLEQKNELGDDWRIQEALGRISSQLGSYKESCIYFHKALASHGEDSSIIKARLGDSYRHLGNEELARAYLNEAYEESPREPLISIFLLQLLKARMLRLSECEDEVSLETELEEANSILDSASQNGILNGDMLFIKGQMLMILQHPQKALQALRAVLDRDPDHPKAPEVILAVEEWLESRQCGSARETGRDPGSIPPESR
jgi:tetratricopeptide (TPR) repeat protein